MHADGNTAYYARGLVQRGYRGDCRMTRFCFGAAVSREISAEDVFFSVVFFFFAFLVANEIGRTLLQWKSIMYEDRCNDQRSGP